MMIPEPASGTRVARQEEHLLCNLNPLFIKGIMVVGRHLSWSVIKGGPSSTKKTQHKTNARILACNFLTTSSTLALAGLNKDFILLH
jgi:hypothetical protein